MAASGYCDCACPDCFEIAIGDGIQPAVCQECYDAGCDLEGECLAAGAYGMDSVCEPHLNFLPCNQCAAKVGAS